MNKTLKTKILCYGDSNTFGFCPNDGSRYPKTIRWTGILAELLGEQYSIIEEGCNNRNGFIKSTGNFIQNGKEYFSECIKKNPNFDILILALGTNDIQKFYDINEQIVNEGLSYYTDTLNKLDKQIRLILVTPVKISKNILNNYFAFQFDSVSIERSIWIQDLYYKFAANNNIELFDVNKYVTPSTIDGLHFDPNSHKIIANQLAEIIEK